MKRRFRSYLRVLGARHELPASAHCRIEISKCLTFRLDGREEDHVFDQIVGSDEPLAHLYHDIFLNCSFAEEGRAAKSALLLFFGTTISDIKAVAYGDGRTGILTSFVSELFEQRNQARQLILTLSVMQERAGCYYDLLGFSEQKLARLGGKLLGAAWVRLNSALDFINLFRFALFNNNTRDYKSSVFEYTAKEPNSLIVGLNVRSPSGRALNYYFVDVLPHNTAEVVQSLGQPRSQGETARSLGWFISSIYQEIQTINLIYSFSLSLKNLPAISSLLREKVQLAGDEDQEARPPRSTRLAQRPPQNMHSELKAYTQSLLQQSTAAESRSVSKQLQESRAHAQKLHSGLKEVTAAKLRLLTKASLFITKNVQVLKYALSLRRISDLYTVKNNSHLQSELKFLHLRQVRDLTRAQNKYYGAVRRFKRFEAQESARHEVVVLIDRLYRQLFQTAVFSNSNFVQFMVEEDSLLGKSAGAITLLSRVNNRFEDNYLSCYKPKTLLSLSFLSTPERRLLPKADVSKPQPQAKSGLLSNRITLSSFLTKPAQFFNYEAEEQLQDQEESQAVKRNAPGQWRGVKYSTRVARRKEPSPLQGVEYSTVRVNSNRLRRGGAAMGRSFRMRWGQGQPTHFSVGELK